MSGRGDRPVGRGAARPGSLAIIAICQVAALSLWFSATAVIPALEAQVGIDAATASWFTGAVQLGFVAGTLASAAFGLADRFDPRLLFMLAAMSGAAANAAIIAVDPTSTLTILLRFATGVAMAGVYPVGMRLAATWARGDMGLMLGLLVGALTLGSATPHLFHALSGVDWRVTLAAASGSALAAALLIPLAGLGPGYAAAPRLRPGAALKAWTTPALRLANLGYLGHMWELSAMWAWIGVFLDQSFRLSFDDPATAARAAALATFATIASGAAGSVAGGLVADRVGRTAFTIGAMAVSGGCALLAGHLFGAAPGLLVALCLIWGASVVADSAQFSASVAELSEPGLVGTMLTVQTSVGFLLTLATIQLVPAIANAAGWSLAFSILALGPAAGIVAMWRLRQRPEAMKLAGGRR